MRFRLISVECQMKVTSQSELDIGGRETCFTLNQINSVNFLRYEVNPLFSQ